MALKWYLHTSQKSCPYSFRQNWLYSRFILEDYDNFLLLGDFNAEVGEEAMQIFCDSYNFKNLAKLPICYKYPNNPSCIDLILTNKANSCCNTLVVETGLS